MRAANQLIDTIHSSGTDTIFSLSGNQIMPIYDAVVDHPMTLVHTRHEAAAVYMADGYARSSGHVGVALVTAAPGLTNAMGPLYAVSQTQTPLVLLSGDSPHGQDHLMPFQQMDQPGLIKNLVKESWRLTNPARIADDIQGAMALARSGRPGPVHIALPQDVLTADSGDYKPANPDAFKPEAMMLSNADLPSILGVIEGAKSPLIITGPSLHPTQANGHTDAIMAALNIPVITMQSPRGLNDPSLGKLRKILKKADAIIFIDKDVDFTLASGSIDDVSAERIAIIAPNAQTISHASSMLSGRMVWGCIGDAITMAKTLAEVTGIKGPKPWFNEVMRALSQAPAKPSQDSMTAYDVANAIATNLDPMPLVIIDGGESGQWAQSLLPHNEVLTNGLSGAIGGSIPQAIGMAMANPKKRVLAFVGDGAAGFYLPELETARRLNLPITFVVANDCRWGAEVEIQLRDYGKARAQGCALDDITQYHKIAEGFGIAGVQVKDLDGFTKALTDAQNSDAPMLINAMIKGLPAPII